LRIDADSPERIEVEFDRMPPRVARAGEEMREGFPPPRPAAADLARDIVLALAPKSVTAGVAMGISETLGANPAITVIATVLTGVMGAIVVTPAMNRLGITDFRARGFAAGLASHGIGTARAFQVDEVAGVFAGIAMGLNALVTSLLVPIAVTLLLR